MKTVYIYINAITNLSNNAIQITHIKVWTHTLQLFAKPIHMFYSN